MSQVFAPLVSLIGQCAAVIVRCVALLCASALVLPMYSAALELQGNKVQGGLLFGQLNAGESVTLDGRKLQLTPDRQFIVGLDRDAKPELALTLHKVSGETETFRYAIGKRDYAIQRINGVAKKHVTPDPKQVERSRAEARQVRKARAARREQDDFFHGFAWPAIGPITGVFGSQRVYNGQPRRPHYGVDVAGPVGTPVVAPAAGLVTLVHDDMFFSGGTMIIDHGHGLSSTFLHLSKILVEEGAVVAQGDLVAEIGATGRVTGPHLDWRMNWHNTRIDPQLLVGPMPDEATLSDASPEQ